jgi:glycine cleavage system H lipoate-binding protein
VGLDDFARRLLGPMSAVRLPETGARLEQGEAGAAVRVDGREADLIAPLSGDVLAVNGELAQRPQLAADDPYGRGWLMRVKPASLSADLRNLLSGSLARRFVEDARERLDLRLMALSGSVLHDGGEPAADFALHISGEQWQRLVGELLLAPTRLIDQA